MNEAMKGVVFTELLDHIEQQNDPVFLETLLAALPLASGAAYTAVGTYDWRELVAIATAYAERTGTTLERVLRTFGRRLFAALAARFSDLVDDYVDARSLLQGLQDLIHPIVQRLYPNAALPSFHAEDHGTELCLVYRSTRPLVDFAHGLVEGCLDHFGCSAAIDVNREPGGATFAVALPTEAVCRTR